MIRKLLIANRGEIACRVIRTAKRMGVATVAVFSDADKGALHVRLADEAVGIGGAPPAESYLNIGVIIEAARRAGADAIHPGYGFLSENADFAEACAAAGFTFVGPPAQAIRTMGDKACAKALMREAGVPVVPGYDGEDQSPERLAEEAKRVGFPVLIKAATGGGGRGMRRVDRAEDFLPALESARRESESAFGAGRVLIEKLVEDARHIEIQIFADRHGNFVHLGERDCSAQRRHQKIIEEAPSPFVDEALRERMGADAVKAARAVGYIGAGTVEFIVAQDGSYHFLEMNTRLQVEHPVTEMVTDFDLVEWQLRVAMGESLPVSQDELRLNGHAVEARLYAEDPYEGFRPETGRVLYWRPETMAAEGVRIDHGLLEGDEVTPFYDPLLAKVIAHGATREEALARLDAALRQARVLGLRTNRSFLLDLLASEAFRDWRMTTGLIGRWAGEGASILKAPSAKDRAFALAAAILMRASGDDWFRSAGLARVPVTLHCEGDVRQLTATVSHRQPLSVETDEGAWDFGALEVDLPRVRYCDPTAHEATALIDGRDLWLDIDGWTGCFSEPDPLARQAKATDHSRIVSPVSGLVRSVLVAEGQHVEARQVLAVVEAMKMETSLATHAAGTVLAVHAVPGEQVRAGDLVAEIAPSEAG